MADYRTNEIVSGLFIALAVAVFAVFAFRVGDADFLGLLRGRPLLCETYFTDVQSLHRGAAVKVGGRPVGKVTEVRLQRRTLTSEQIERLRRMYGDAEAASWEGAARQLIAVLFELSDPTLELDPGSARVFLRQDSLLSPHFLELDPGMWAAGEETPSTILDLSAGDGERVFIAAEERGGIGEILGALAASVGEVQAILETVRDELLTPEHARTFRHAIANLDATITESRAIAERVGALLDPQKDPRIQGILDELAGALRGLGPRLDRIEDDVRRLIRTIGEGSGELLGGARGLVLDNRAEIAETVRRLRRAAWEAELALRKVRADPSVLLFGGDDGGGGAVFDPVPVDETALRRTGRARPYEQRDETGAAAR